MVTRNFICFLTWIKSAVAFDGAVHVTAPSHAPAQDPSWGFTGLEYVEPSMAQKCGINTISN